MGAEHHEKGTRGAGQVAAASYALAPEPSAGSAASNGGSTGLSLDQSVSLTAGNVLGNGRNDIVVINRGSRTISVLANDGNGGFLDPAPTRTSSTSDGFTVNNQPGPVVAGDFDHDGHLDLAILMEDRSEVWIFTGDGEGHFFHTFTIAAGESPTGTSAAGAAGKLPRELFRILGAVGRCGLWAHAASVSRVSARSDRGKRLMGGVAKFRTFRRRATFPAPEHGSSWCRTLLGQGPEFNR